MVVTDYLTQISSKFVQYFCKAKELPMTHNNEVISSMRLSVYSDDTSHIFFVGRSKFLFAKSAIFGISDPYFPIPFETPKGSIEDYG